MIDCVYTVYKNATAATFPHGPQNTLLLFAAFNIDMNYYTVKKWVKILFIYTIFRVA